MSHHDYDEGLVHAHNWASEAYDRTDMPQVADASSVNTPSSVFHDDAHHRE